MEGEPCRVLGPPVHFNNRRSRRFDPHRHACLSEVACWGVEKCRQLKSSSLSCCATKSLNASRGEGALQEREMGGQRHVWLLMILHSHSGALISRVDGAATLVV